MIFTVLMFLGAFIIGFLSLNSKGETSLAALITAYVMPVISIAFGLAFSVNVMNAWYGMMQITTANWSIAVWLVLAFVPGLLGVWLGQWATHCMDKCRPAGQGTSDPQ